MGKVVGEYMKQKSLKAEERMNAFGEVKDKSDPKMEDKETKLD